MQDGTTEELETIPNAYKLDYNLTKYSKTACQRTCIQREVKTEARVKMVLVVS